MNCIAISSHKSSYPTPIRLEPGDIVTVGRRDQEYPGWIWVITSAGNEGWAPESHIRIGSLETAVAKNAYTSRELDTQVGEYLSCKVELNGWLWVENVNGDSGWVPKTSVRAV